MDWNLSQYGIGKEWYNSKENKTMSLCYFTTDGVKPIVSNWLAEASPAMPRSGFFQLGIDAELWLLKLHLRQRWRHSMRCQPIMDFPWDSESSALSLVSFFRARHRISSPTISVYWSAFCFKLWTLAGSHFASACLASFSVTLFRIHRSIFYKSVWAFNHPLHRRIIASIPWVILWRDSRFVDYCGKNHESLEEWEVIWMYYV